MKARLAASGMITAYGTGLAALWSGLMAGQTAITQTDWFDARGFASRCAGLVPGVAPGGEVPRAWRLLRPVLAPLRGKLPPATPLLLATTVGEIEHLEDRVLSGAAAAGLAAPDRLLRKIQAEIGLTGMGRVVSAACASGAVAVARAAALVASGRAEMVLVVGVDAVSEFIFSGFSSLLVLSATPARPFDRRRDGLTVGEAAAWALVTRADAVAPEGLDGDAAAADILGWGCTSDAHHMTAPHPAGDGLARAMTQALAGGETPAAAVAFICAHGTGTLPNDAMEIQALRRCFAEPTPWLAIKGGTGHTMGAAGLVELIVTAAALRDGVIPPTVGLAEPEPAAAKCLARTPRPVPGANRALSVNSGFGGVNAAVLLGRAEP